MPTDTSDSQLNNSIRKSLNQLTTNITYIVLGGYIIFLVFILVKAMMTESNDANNEWISIFKNGFLVLGGILTTLIGYYFGNRGSDLAMQSIERVRKENQDLVNQLNDLSPTTDETTSTSGMEPIKIK